MPEDGETFGSPTNRGRSDRAGSGVALRMQPQGCTMAERGKFPTGFPPAAGGEEPMRIMLVDPPFYRFMGYYNRYFPLGLVSIGTVLREAGHDVVVYDADANRHATKADYSRLREHYAAYVAGLNTLDHPLWRELRENLRTYRPQLIGISGFTPKFGAVARIAEIAKEDDPDRPVILGGPHATLRPEEALRNCPHIDVAVIGEGETTALEVVEHFGSQTGPPLAQIPGLAFRANGAVMRTAGRQRAPALDDVPMPARELLLRNAHYSAEDMGLIMTSRGCPFHCGYCAVTAWGRTVAYRSTAKVVAEMRLVRDRYGTRQFAIKDDTFTVNRKRVVEFCERLIAERLRVNWECNTRVNLVDEPLLRRMKRAGCNEIKFGIESGSERVLATIDKGITRDDARRTAALMRKVGILWSGYFMLGLPGETAEDARQTLEFMRELRPNFAAIAVYEPFPQTALFAEGVARGLVEPEMTPGDYSSRIPSDLYVKDPSRRVDGMSPEEFRAIEQLLKVAFNRHNVHVGRLWRRARSRARTYLSEPLTVLEDGKKLMGLVRSGAPAGVVGLTR